MAHSEQPRGHLLAYPIDVNVSLHDNFPIVTLHARTKRGRFPDKRAKILGRGSKSIPNKLTTWTTVIFYLYDKRVLQTTSAFIYHHHSKNHDLLFIL